MDHKLEEDEQFLQKLENQFESVRLEPDQREIFLKLAEMAAQYVPLSLLEIRAFMIEAIKTWEQETETSFKDLSTSSPDVRISSVQHVFSIIEAELLKVVGRLQEKILLKEGFKKVFAFYTDNFAKR